MVGDGNRPTEDNPLHDLTTWRCGQGACVPVVATQRRGQEVSEDKRIQEGLLLCLGKEVRRSQQPEIHSLNPRPTQTPTQPIPPEALPPGGRRTSENEVASQSGVVETPEQAAFLIDLVFQPARPG